MGSDGEPAKLLLPYLQRADELQKHEPLVAYYCRLYAMERGLKIPQKERTKTTNALLISLMNQLEKDKKSLKLGPEDNLYIEGFASNVFAKADKQDRAGRADLNTAKTFYAASIFFEILNQFGELQPDLEQKQKYAVWKAADIRKALKEGRRPEPGPPGGDKDATPAGTPANSYDLGPSQSFPTSQPGFDTSPQHVEKPSPSHDLGRSESFSTRHPEEYAPKDHTERVNPQDPTPPPFSPPSYSTGDYPPNGPHQLPTNNRPEAPSYTQQYHPNPYSTEQPHMPQTYLPPENPDPSFSYPNFQTYPSSQESTFPSVPSHQPSYYHGADASSYSPQQPPLSSYPSNVQYYHNNEIANQTAPPAPPAESYKYDSSYEPSLEKIGEAHKAARFAVGALAFDDVPVAVEHLRRALELLTNPSAELH
ncbi:Protein MAMMALIAN LYST-INTERACTING PROTEIN 5 [Ananas comosus]|uniref:Protein MAMMALIAN LYST-INTERACTING PROTEIN 5 n=1 Tax=Ananas comosus TaxID=4615 RepID=A0A199W7A6_ANACO|nr:Protein MAMMALIAN LYST-INTERACTING PROTEIN 5 [Ananas comosus]